MSPKNFTRSREAAKMKPKPLIPAATEAELNEASRVWTAAQDVMVARGFGRELWGNQRGCCHEFIVLMLRAYKKTSANCATRCCMYNCDGECVIYRGVCPDRTGAK